MKEALEIGRVAAVRRLRAMPEATRMVHHEGVEAMPSLRSIRVAAGLSIRDVAAMLGVSDVRIGEIERGGSDNSILRRYFVCVCGFLLGLRSVKPCPHCGADIPTEK